MQKIFALQIRLVTIFSWRKTSSFFSIWRGTLDLYTEAHRCSSINQTPYFRPPPSRLLIHCLKIIFLNSPSGGILVACMFSVHKHLLAFIFPSLRTYSSSTPCFPFFCPLLLFFHMPPIFSSGFSYIPPGERRVIQDYICATLEL